MARKTFSVAEMIDWTNKVLAMDYDVFTPDHKQGLINALDHVLHATDTYFGFRYLDHYDENDPEFRFEGRKNVRREYFKHPSLSK